MKPVTALRQHILTTPVLGRLKQERLHKLEAGRSYMVTVSKDFETSPKV